MTRVLGCPVADEIRFGRLGRKDLSRMAREFLARKGEEGSVFDVEVHLLGARLVIACRSGGDRTPRRVSIAVDRRDWGLEQELRYPRMTAAHPVALRWVAAAARLGLQDVRLDLAIEI